MTSIARAAPLTATTAAATEAGSTSTPSSAVNSPMAVAIIATGVTNAPTPAADSSSLRSPMEIPIRLTLGGATLSLGAAGQWDLEHSALQQFAERTRVLQERNERLEKENAQLRERCLRVTEESNMEKFKCQLLIEMLAVSSLDEEKSASEAEQERVKAASVQSDMLALLDQARREGLDVRKLAGVLTSPQSNSRN